jgi:uncharacterized protein YndB with AHSA1/START domain
MTQASTSRPFGVLTEPATLTLERLLPGSIDRVWAYLTESDLRRQWMAAGVMDMRVGGTTELVWRNNELTDPPGEKPEGFGDEHRLEIEITELRWGPESRRDTLSLHAAWRVGHRESGKRGR